MARQLRIELAGGLYHITSRGDRREVIYEDDDDRLEWLSLLGRVCDRFNWQCHAYCLMDNHYHIVVETADANLSSGMRQLNGVYTQYHNRRHSRAGHVFQGRFKGILVEKEAYLLELSRYVVLNPLRARRVAQIEDWFWSSYLAMCGEQVAPEWLETNWVLGQFSQQKTQAIRQYVNFVREGVGLNPIWAELKKQIYLGSDQFISTMLNHVTKSKQSVKDVPRIQYQVLPKTLTDYQANCSNRNEAIRAAFLSGGYTMKEIGDYFGLHYTSVSRIVNQQG